MAEYRPPTPERPVSPEQSAENQVERPEYTEQRLEQERQQEQQGLDNQAEAARRHMAEMIEEQKNTQKASLSDDDDDDVDLVHVPKKEKSFTAWLEHISPEERVPVSKKLILTKGKKLVDVIHAFLLIEDFSGLDQLEEELSESYNDLVSNGVVPDLRRK